MSRAMKHAVLWGLLLSSLLGCQSDSLPSFGDGVLPGSNPVPPQTEPELPDETSDEESRPLSR